MHVRCHSRSGGVGAEVKTGLAVKADLSSGVLDGCEHRHEEIGVESLWGEERRHMPLRDHNHMGSSGRVGVMEGHDAVIVVEPINSQVS